MAQWSPKVEDVWRETVGGGVVVYKTKIIQFLGRSTPIVLENSNTPCLLSAICNVLLLRNELDLSLETEEVSQEKLLKFLSKRISKSANISQKEGGHAVIESRCKMADAVGLLCRLSSGTYVNPCFRKIDEFENTAEHAIFDLLGITLYHGWIVDPKDYDTAQAIGSLSYKSASDTLAAFHAPKGNLETAVPAAPSKFSNTKFSVKRGRGDMEEIEELRRVLNLSKIEINSTLNKPLSPEFVTSDSALGSESCGSVVDSDSPLVTTEEEPSECYNYSPLKDGYVNCKLTDSSLPSESIENAKRDYISDTLKDESSQQTCAVDFSTPDICQMSDNDIEDKILLCYSEDNLLGEEIEEAEVNTRSGLQDAVGEKEWNLVQNFLSETESQLTNYGLRCLHEGLKDEELCILFHNNHFRTMIKYSGEIFLLMTDQGYKDGTDVVWEKLRKMNGNAEFMTGDFKNVSAVNQDASPNEVKDYNVDLEMAMALQEMEFDGPE